MKKKESIKTPKTTLLGNKRNIILPSFFVKLICLGAVTTFFFVDSGIPKYPAVLALLLLTIVLLKKHSFKIIPFLCLSTIVMSIVWFLFSVNFFVDLNAQAALSRLFENDVYIDSLCRIWGIFLSGQLFLGVSSQYELLLDLKRIKAPASVSLFVVIIFNAVAYFIKTYSQIKNGFEWRMKKKYRVVSIYYVFCSLIFDAISVIFECRKVFWLDKNRVINSVKTPKHIDFAIGEINSPETINMEIKTIQYAESENTVIEDTSLCLSKGVQLLLGENGSGKSTLFQAMTGIIPEIINGKSDLVINADKVKFDREKISYTLQGIESTLLYNTVQKMFAHLPIAEVRRWLEHFELSHLLDGERLTSELSAGESKVVSILSNLLDTKFDVYLLDEPTMYLSEEMKKKLIFLLDHIAKSKIITIATHDLTLINYYSIHFRIKDGKICSNAEPVLSFEKTSLLRNDVHNYYTLSVPQPLLPNSTKYLHEKEIKIPIGGSMLIYGGNGAGKTTLGSFVCNKINKERKCSCVMMLQELNKQFFTTTVMSEVLLGLKSDKTTTVMAKDYLNRLGINEALIEQPPQFISGGEKRLILICSLLMQNADVVILDEPFDSLDFNHIQLLVKLLTFHQSNTGCTYIFIDQNKDIFESVVDHFVEVKDFVIQ